MKSDLTPKRALMHGALWTVGSRWTIRLIGFVSTMVMARLLAPDDYGLIAMAMLLASLVQAVLDFGANTALLRKEAPSRAEIDSAWTLCLLQGGAIALLIAVTSPLAVDYFKEPRVAPLLWVLALCMLLANAGNVGITLAQKAFDFGLVFRVHVLSKLAGTLVTIACGVLLRDYRALIAGIVVSYVSGFCLSYAMHPYRPRLDFSKTAEIWGVTKWLMLSGLGSFVLRKGDELAATRLGSTGEYGLYNVGADFGQMPIGEVGPAVLRAFLPVLSTIQSDVARTNNAVIKTLAAVNTITMPIGAGFAVVASQAVAVVLGVTWQAAEPYVGAFAVVATIQVMCNPASTLLVLRGHTRQHSTAVWVEFLVFAGSALLLVPGHSLLGLTYARMLGSLTNAGLILFMAHKRCGLPLGGAVAAILRPALGALGMAWVINHYVLPHVNGTGWQLAAAIVSGAAMYVAWSMLSWYQLGRPDGLESTVVDQLQAIWRRRAGQPKGSA